MTTEKFHHTINGKKITLPHVKDLPFGVIRKVRSKDEAEVVFFLLEEVATKRTLDIIDNCSMDEVGELFEAWQKASGFVMGESPASSTR